MHDSTAIIDRTALQYQVSTLPPQGEIAEADLNMASVTSAEAEPPQDLFGTTETAASRVAANSLLMSTIFGYLHEPYALLDCILMNREQFPIAARALYRYVEEDDVLALWRRGCSLVSDTA